MNKNILILLRCIAAGDKTIFQTPNGDYVSVQCRGMNSIVPEGSEERSIEGRLQYELYGEYPLSPSQMPDWVKVSKAFNGVKNRFAFEGDIRIKKFMPECRVDVENAANGIDGIYITENDKTIEVWAKAGCDEVELRLQFERAYKSTLI